MKKVKHTQNKAFSLNIQIFNELNLILSNLCLQKQNSISNNPILLSHNKGKSPPGCWQSPGTD